MPVPSYEQLMPIVLRLATEERRVRDAIAIVSDELHLTEEERKETIPSGSETLISNRLQWALSYLVQADRLPTGNPTHACSGSLQELFRLRSEA